jgi:hypothetical protein
VQGWPILLAQLARTSFSMLALSLIVALAGALATSLYFYKLLQKFQGHIDVLLCLNMFFFGQIAKYIPGKVWTLVFQGFLGQGRARPSSIILANIDLTALQINNSTCVGLSLLFFLSGQYLLLVACVIVAGLFCHLLSISCFIPKLIHRLSSRIKQLAKLDSSCQPAISARHSLSFFVLHFITMALGHALLLLAVFAMSPSEALFYTALLALSWVIGMVTLISPAGMGIREMAFILLANIGTHSVDLQTLAAIAVVTRLWMIMQELTANLLLYLYNKRQTASRHNHV